MGLVHWRSTHGAGAGHIPGIFSLHAAYSALRHFCMCTLYNIVQSDFETIGTRVMHGGRIKLNKMLSFLAAVAAHYMNRLRLKPDSRAGTKIGTILRFRLAGTRYGLWNSASGGWHNNVTHITCSAVVCVWWWRLTPSPPSANQLWKYVVEIRIKLQLKLNLELSTSLGCGGAVCWIKQS